MESNYFLTALIFLPAVVGILMSMVQTGKDGAKIISLITLAGTFVMSIVLMMRFDTTNASMQTDTVLNLPWIPSFNINYFIGLDGISFPLVILTTFLSLLCIGAAWNIEKHTRAYCVLFLLLVTGMIGVFVSLDLFMFYVFWEVMLLPMYFLIGIWGGPRKEYAALKFFLFTLFGSVLMLIAILMLYFNSDLAHDHFTPQVLTEVCHMTPADVQSIATEKEAGRPVHTFNILALQQMGQHTDLFSGEVLLGRTMQWWAFLLLFIGFLIKVPGVPVHTWLPDAHVEAPTPISMILAGVLLKMGGYGIIRICYPICPQGGYELTYFVCFIGVLSMVYGAYAALAQKDFKRLVAYSSVSHMGYVVLGFGVWSAYAGNKFDPQYWQLAMNGAMFQMIGHGISSAGMFFMVGVIYDRVHHRNLDEFGGLFAKMPIYSGMAVGIFFAGLGLPGLCGFIGEVFVLLGTWNFSRVLAIISAAVVILTAGYILWTIQRVYLGAEYRGPHAEALTPMTGREKAIGGVLLAFAIILGVFPQQTVFRFITPSVNQTVQQLADWTERNHPAGEKPAAQDTQITKAPGQQVDKTQTEPAKSEPSESK
jgi:NADH-quinone oxidoreductase subunit M